MKNKLLWIIPGAIIILLIIGYISSYNSLVSASQNVDAHWAQVQNVYQRRADLIPNLVATVKGYAAHEKNTLVDVINARSAAISQSAQQNTQSPNQSQLDNYAKAQSALTNALGRLMVVVERYPDLKASQNFLALQDELAGTENRITVERQRFNVSVRDYNLRVQSFPSNIIARMMHYTTKAYFKANPQAEIAPKVSF
jgi:LemA protein